MFNIFWLLMLIIMLQINDRMLGIIIILFIIKLCVWCVCVCVFEGFLPVTNNWGCTLIGRTTLFRHVGMIVAINTSWSYHNGALVGFEFYKYFCCLILGLSIVGRITQFSLEYQMWWVRTLLWDPNYPCSVWSSLYSYAIKLCACIVQK